MVGKIGAVSKRSPVKPAAKRVAKPGAKPAVKPGAKPVAKSAVKRVAKPGAKPGAKPAAKRAGVKRATPKAKKVNFNKLLIIIRNVANRTHKKGRMTGGALEDAKNTILKYLISSDLTTAIIGLIKNDDRNDVAKGTNTPEDNYLLRIGGDMLKVGDGSLAELLSIIDKVLVTMRGVTGVTGVPSGSAVTVDDIKNIATSINLVNQVNYTEIEEINKGMKGKLQTTPVGAAATATTAINPADITTGNNIKDSNTISIDDAFKPFNSVAISHIIDNKINDEYEKLINKLTALKYEAIYDHIKKTPAIDDVLKKNFAMLMIAITLAKIHDIIKGM